jgi:hypothetical protein
MSARLIRIAVRGGLSTFVIAVGAFGTLMATTQNAGASASGIEAPVPANANASGGVGLTNVACPKAGRCVAVGSYRVRKKQDSLIETLSKNGWQPIEAPLPSAPKNPYASSVLLGVSCSSASSCVAVGADSSGPTGVIDSLANGAWHSIRAPLPANAAKRQRVAQLDDVSCSSGTCAAIGFYNTPSYKWSDAVIDTSVNGEWSTMEAPLPPDATDHASSAPAAVSCPSSTFCAAGGSYFGDLGQVGVLWTWVDGAWSAVEAPLPADASSTAPDTGISAMTCPAAGSCVALGNYVSSDGTEYGFVDTLSQGTWLPTQLIDGGFYQVSCDSLISCAASSSIGPTGSGSVTGHLVDVLSGGSWVPVSVPMPPDSGDPPEALAAAVSCQPGGFCVAGGFYYNTSGTPEAMVMSGTGANWSSAAAAMPSNAGPAVPTRPTLTAVACPPAGPCVAVGNYNDTSDDLQGVIETVTPDS